MHESYEDITSRIKQPPLWWDEYAVPRYCRFEPRRAANIYADYVALIEIACQGCGVHFKVAMSQHKFEYMLRGTPPWDMLENARKGDLHYGDPPNYSCCAAGPTMNSVPLMIWEFWRRGSVETSMLWERINELDLKDLTPDWAEHWEDHRGAI